MSIHKPTEILLVTNNGLVQTSGGSTKLAKGVVGIANRALPNTVDGVPLVNAFPATGNYEIRYGVSDYPVTRSNSNKSWRSLPFNLDEIVDIKVSAPSLKSAVDEVWIGYDGINEDSAISLENGETALFDIMLKGEGLALLGYPNGEFIHQFAITAPTTGDVNMQKLIIEAVEDLKNVQLYGGASITDYVDITPVDSTRIDPVGTDFTIYTLTVPNAGTSNDQALVKQQYPNLDIKFSGSVGGQAQYVVAATSQPTAFNVVTTTITTDCDEYVSSADTTTTINWVAGETCTAVEQEYILTLADDECGENRLEEVEAAYPDLDISLVVQIPGEGEDPDITSVNCQSQYTTTILSDIICEECSPIILDLISSEAPHPFDMIEWTRAEEAFDEAALLGIRFRGKETVSEADYPYDKFVPFVDDFVRISVSGGYTESVMENFIPRTNPFPVRLIRRGYQREALGYTFRDLEDRARVYFTGVPSYSKKEVYAELVTGQETLLKNSAQYAMYSITIRRKRYAQSLSQTHEQNVKYDLLVEVGKHKSLETFVNTLATAAGLPTVQAYGGQ